LASATFLAGTERRQRRLQPGRADEPVDHHGRVRMRGRIEQGLAPAAPPGAVPAVPLRQFTLGQDRERRVPPVNEALQALAIPVAGQRRRP
jgi:hypothetical protein